jgi:DNA polymerase-3 subunit delta'
MSFSTILGQDRAVATLRAALSRGQLHHAYLFGGPDGVGKERCARTLAQAANCERNDGDACGACGACRRIAGRNHADVLLILPEAEQVARGFAGRADFEGTPSREIKIGQIRKLQERLSLKALEARRKFALLLSVEAMNTQAQNALLKTLEEPPSDTTLVLVSAAPYALLPTIRSRCLPLAFAPLPLSLVAARVVAEKKTDPESARVCAALSGGSLSAALALDPATMGRRKALVARIESLLPGDARGALSFSAEFAEDRAQAEVHLDLLSVWYRDVAAAASGAPPEALVNVDLGDWVQASARRHCVPEALRRIELIERTKASLRANAQPRLQMEQLVLRFLFSAA